MPAPAQAGREAGACRAMSPSPLAEEAVRLLQPLIGIRGRHAGQTLELVEVLDDGPMVALLDASASPRIQTNQFGDPLTRQPRILTIPVLSEIEADAHPVLRSLLPEAILEELRSLIQAHRSGPGSRP
jgi:hypothetical protein